MHKTIGDYFKVLSNSGFNKFPLVEELFVTPELIATNESFFEPLRGTPLHMLFSLKK